MVFRNFKFRRRNYLQTIRSQFHQHLMSKYISRCTQLFCLRHGMYDKIVELLLPSKVLLMKLNSTFYAQYWVTAHLGSSQKCWLNWPLYSILQLTLVAHKCHFKFQISTNQYLPLILFLLNLFWSISTSVKVTDFTCSMFSANFFYCYQYFL